MWPAPNSTTRGLQLLNYWRYYILPAASLDKRQPRGYICFEHADSTEPLTT